MCGLIFLDQPTCSNEQAEARSRNALHLLRHRGPDGQALQHVGQSWLGHVRLAIIDIASSHQPMSDASGRWHIVFNGEIYNYRELRQNLASSWPFQSQGDTEVLLAGLSLHGPAFLRQLRGMWALCWLDRQTGQVLLSRDRMGKKPLYYTQHGARIAAASELPALLTLTEFDGVEDTDSLADYFRYGYTLPGHTFYRHVNEVLPGHYLVIENDSIRQRPYWEISPSPFQGSFAEAIEQARSLFDQALRRRMVADVEVGAFLSGGVDSSLIVASLHQLYPGHSFKTFTIGFDDPSHDERIYARRVAQLYDTQHIEDVLQEPDPQDLRQLLHAHLGQAFSDSSILPTQLASQLAARSVKVALSGDGGDELFCGYERYFARQFMRWYTRLPRSFHHLIEKTLYSLPEPRQHHSRSLLKKAHLFLQSVDRLESETPYYAPRFYTDKQIAALWPGLERHGHTPAYLPQTSHLDDLGRMMLADCAVYLPQDILTKVDRASMSVSLETRAPFLDADFVDFSLSLPSAWHHGWRHGKRFLQQAFSDRLPQEVWRRRKQGFASPIHRWMGGSHLETMLNLARHSPLDGRMLEQLVDEHRQGRKDHGYRLWLIYVYLLSPSYSRNKVVPPQIEPSFAKIAPLDEPRQER